MTFNRLASLITKREGKKHQASIGDVREIMKIYFDLICSDEHGCDVCNLQDAEVENRYKKIIRKKK